MLWCHSGQKCVGFWSPQMLKEILNFLDTTEKNSQMRNTGM